MEGSGDRLMSDGYGFGGGLPALIRRPILLWEAIRTGFAMRAHRGLFPSSVYVDWRVHTAYGAGMSETRQADLESYLLWRRRMRALS
ncbi:MAG: hypothetical protein ACRDZM_03560 [Acidimicrobiia bacterium]